MTASLGEIAQAQLVQLVAYLTTVKQTTGDATLILRHQVYPGGPTVDANDLYADNGDYYFSLKASGLPAQVKK